MAEHSSSDWEIGDDLLDLISSLRRAIRANIPREDGAEQGTQEWQDLELLRTTVGQIRLLRILLERQRCTMQELAEALAVAQPSVTAMVKRLLAQELVERMHDEQDWRLVWVYLTERGLKAVTLYLQLQRATLQRRLERLEPEELARLRAALPVLRHLIEVEP